MNKKIRVGIVGLGRAGRLMQAPELHALPNRFEIVAACDNDPARLQDLPEAFRGARLYGDYAEMLRDSAVDLIAIATRHPEHVPMTIAALEAGKYVSHEKPCALSVAEMDRLLAEARRHPGHLFLRHNRRFEAAFQKARSLMATGVLGEINTIKIYRSVGYSRRNDWMTLSEFGGGLLTNWGPHMLDQALQLLESPVVDCWASIRSVISIGDGDDHIKILLRAQNGRVADVEISGAHTLPGREIEIQGARGTLVCPVDGKILMRFVDPAIEFKKLQAHRGQPPFQYGNFDEKLSFIEQRVDIPEVPGYAIWNHIYDSIVNGVPFPVTLEQGAEVVRVTQLALEKSGFQAQHCFWRF